MARENSILRIRILLCSHFLWLRNVININLNSLWVFKSSLIVIRLSFGHLIMIPDVRINLFDINLVLFVFRLFSIILRHFLSMFALLLGVIKSTDLRLVASRPITIDSFVLIGMVQPFHRSVALVAEKSFWAEFPYKLRVVAAH